MSLAIWAIWAPLAAALALLAVPVALRQAVGFAASLAAAVPVWLLVDRVRREGSLRGPIGWPQPLGVELHADALALPFIALTALVGVGVACYAIVAFRDRGSLGPWDAPVAFWPLWLLLWGALNTLYLSSDLFNVYVGLELVTLAAIGLVVLPGTRVTLAAALQYLIAALAGSLAFLFGLALLYARHGGLDLFELGATLEPGPVAQGAFALLALGLMVKAAVFPLHFWLPDAHGHALPPVSALLSGLVVKAGFYLLVRLSFDTFGAVLDPNHATAIGAVAVLGIAWASLHAMGQARLKRLLAYSTVAQLGLMMLLFPLVVAGGAPTGGMDARTFAGWGGGVTLALSHGLAKAALFLCAGAFIEAVGSDALRDLAGMARHLPLAFAAFVLASWTLLGLPPSGGYAAKSLYLEAAAGGSPWGWAVQGATLLTAVYLAIALRAAWGPPRAPASLRRVPLALQAVPFALASIAALLGWLLPGMVLAAP
jgi:multicomponent Na+:H+ antiporter subunit D